MNDNMLQEIDAMSEVLKHGGPDASGIFTDKEKGVLFAHRRLSIIDLTEGGGQPMPSRDSRFVISFNGEIYNYQQIRDELKKLGRTFYSESDTEVILTAYDVWGTDAFQLFNGMFAFALFDKEKNEILLVRDQSGIKPLYYGFHNNTLYFASEVRAFNKNIFPENNTWKILFLSFGFIPEPYTTRKDIVELEKGCVLIFHLSERSVHIKPFFNKPEAIKIKDADEAIHLLRPALTKAVEQHLIADAPLGVFLSGGIDSTLLTLLAAEHQENLHTLSVIFEEQSYSEKRYQEQVLAITKTNHSFYTVTQNDFENQIEDIFSDYDMPSNDGINTWFISKAAKENGLKAVLSGIGADELFGGYPSFRRTKHIPALRALPNIMRKNIANYLPHKWQRIHFLSLNKPVGDYLFLRGFFSVHEVAALLNIDEQEVVSVLNSIPYKGPLPDNAGNYAAWLEQNIYMQNQLLKDSDVMSMTHGVEIRVPFLDKNVRALMDAIDPKIKFGNQRPKDLLIRSFENILPAHIVNRKKMGFVFPFQEWLKGMDLYKDLYAKSAGIHKGFFDQYANGRLHWSKVWALLLVNK